MIRKTLLKLIWWLHGFLERLEILLDSDMRKIEKEFKKYELKFKKKDPFKLENGDWAVSYERLKELLEE